MLKNNKLLDLFVVGKEVEISDDSGNSVTVWLQKVNPSEHEAITRRANAARARSLATKKDPESDEYLEVYGDVLDMEKEEMIQEIISEEIANKAAAIESELSEKEEWIKDNYLQGLRDSWLEGLSERYFLEKDEESTKVFEELKRFAEQVAKELEAERANLTADHLERTLDAVVADAVEAKISGRANIEWLKTFRKGQLVYAVRDQKDHSQKLLDWQSVDLLQEDAWNLLTDAYQSMTVPPIEGKD